jgi:pilus assembly protein CpaE
MATTKITAGLLIPDADSREHVRILAEATGLISVEIESDQYCTKPRDTSARQFIHSQPEIILVDMEDPQAGVSSLQTLHGALPETRLFAISNKADPKLIIQAVRAGAREFLPKPIQPRSLSQAIERHVAEKERLLESKEGKVFCFTAGKEGSGVTSIAVNVASALAEEPGTRVALIDLDSPMGDAAIYLNLAPQHKVEDVFGAASRLDSLLLESCMSQVDGFYVLPAPREWGKQKTPGADMLAQLLKIASQSYTHTIVDLPRSFSSEQMQAVAKAAETLVIVLNPELSSISRTGHLLRHLSDTEAPDKIRLVLNRNHDSNEIAAAMIEKALHYPIYYRIPDNYRESVKAMMSGKPLARNTKSDLAQSYHGLARQLAGIPDPKKQPLSGMMQRSSWKNALVALFSFRGKSDRSHRPATHSRHATKASGAHLRMNVLNR